MLLSEADRIVDRETFSVDVRLPTGSLEFSIRVLSFPSPFLLALFPFFILTSWI